MKYLHCKKIKPQNINHIEYEDNKIFKKNFNDNTKISLIKKNNLECKKNNIIK